MSQLNYQIKIRDGGKIAAMLTVLLEFFFSFVDTLEAYLNGKMDAFYKIFRNTIYLIFLSY